jgi:hypothetical protein
MSANRTISRRLLSWLAGAFLAVTAGAFLAGCGSSGSYYDYDYGYGSPTYYDYGYDNWAPMNERRGEFYDYDRGRTYEHGERWGGHEAHGSSGHGEGSSSGHSGRR